MADAYEDAIALLARRPLGRNELSLRLRRKGHANEAVEAAVGRLEAAGTVDDRAFARSFIATRVTARGRGRARAIAELCARGIDPEVAARAFGEASAEGDVDEARSLARAVSRRLGRAPRATAPARLARVYNALLSEGFEPDAVASALVPYGFEGIER